MSLYITRGMIGPSTMYNTVMFLSFRTDRPGQTVQTQIRLLQAVWSGSTRFAISSASFGCISLRKSRLVQLLGWPQQIFRCPKFYDFYGTMDYRVQVGSWYFFCNGPVFFCFFFFNGPGVCFFSTMDLGCGFFYNGLVFTCLLSTINYMIKSEESYT